MAEQERVVMPAYPKQAWLYHHRGVVDNLWQKCSEEHPLALSPAMGFCVTHRPTSPCTCGVYTIRWMTEND